MLNSTLKNYFFLFFLFIFLLSYDVSSDFHGCHWLSARFHDYGLVQLPWLVKLGQ